MAQTMGRRRYDVVILSDHGMTPAVSYRVRFEESLGATVQKVLDGFARETGEQEIRAFASYAETTEYGDVGAQVLEAAAQVTPAAFRPVQRVLRRARDWLRSRYGLREIVMPEKYRVDERNEVVVTYSSCLALVYFADDDARLELGDLARDELLGERLVGGEVEVREEGQALPEAVVLLGHGLLDLHDHLGLAPHVVGGAEDRGALGDTMIGEGTKIDNLVQIGHNCRIGRMCLIAAMSGLAGTTVLEDGVLMGGGAGTSGHLTIGKGSVVNGRAAVTKDWPAGSKLAGAPAQDIRDFWREIAATRKLAKGAKRG